MQLEDDFTDIIKKARNGQGLSVADLGKKTGIDAAALTGIERGQRGPLKEEIDAIARSLGLRPGPLAQIAEQRWHPDATPHRVTQVETILGDIGGYEVKGYVLYDADAREAVLIDTGYNAKAMAGFLDKMALRLKAICLTHGHSDHAGKLDQLLARWPVPVFLGGADFGLAPWLPQRESLAQPEDGRAITVGRLTVHCMTTPGHTPGGICYRVKTETSEICFVGDTLFAGSIGRANPFSLYPLHLESVRRRVLRLPEGTILFPGHGPATTVSEEIRQNPFAESREPE